MKSSVSGFLLLALLLTLSCGRKVVYKTIPHPAPGLTESDTPPQDYSHIPFVTIPGGSFLMGDVEGAGASEERTDERPVHRVTVSGFRMSATEITNAQYARYLTRALETGDIAVAGDRVRGAKGLLKGLEYINLAGTIEDQFPGNRCWITFRDRVFSVEKGREDWPVVYITWFGAKAFAKYYGLDIPTEAEWEYACRGGRQFLFGTRDGKISTTAANFDNVHGAPVEVRSYPPNPFGLYDMSGNVWEWCHDRYGPYSAVDATNPTGVPSSYFRVLRGGSWNLFAFHCRAADRNIDLPFGKADYLGFRVVRREPPRLFYK